MTNLFMPKEYQVTFLFQLLPLKGFKFRLNHFQCFNIYHRDLGPPVMGASTMA